MEFRYISNFVATAEELNISKASRRLNVSQPAVSRLIRDLEDEMRIHRFIRKRIGLELAVRGEKFLAYTRQILDLTSEAVKVVRSLSFMGTLSTSSH